MKRRQAIAWAALLCATPAVTSALNAVLEGSFAQDFDELVAIAVDEATGRIYAADRQDEIRVMEADGTPLLRIPAPGVRSNDLDLDFALAPLTIGGTTVPAGTLLVFNGDERPDTLYGIDPSDGAVLASVTLATNSMVGGAHLPGAGHVATIEYTSDRMSFLDPVDGSFVASFVPELPFDIYYGDIDYSVASDSLFVVSSEMPIVRELDTAGMCMRDIDVGHLGITTLSGVAIDEQRGDYWFASVPGTIYRVRLSPTPVDIDADGWFDEDDNCVTAANADQRDTDDDGIGNACDADLDNNCNVDFLDLGMMKAAFFSSDANADLNGDGSVSFGDLAIMKPRMFLPPGPSGEGGPCGCGQ